MTIRYHVIYEAKEYVMTIGIALAKRHPLVTFFTLTYLISWLPLLFGDDPFPFGPLIAAVVNEVSTLLIARLGLTAEEAVMMVTTLSGRAPVFGSACWTTITLACFFGRG
jgi:hypothetical protein